MIKPYKLDISQFGERVRDRMRFNIKNVSDQDLSLKLVAGPAELMEIKLPETIPAGKSVRGTVILKKSALNENFEKSFTFEVNDEQMSRFTIPVKREIRSPVVKPETASAPSKDSL